VFGEVAHDRINQCVFQIAACSGFPTRPAVIPRYEAP
jgi:hypothetical protein